jgi:hypothetical protein
MFGIRQQREHNVRVERGSSMLVLDGLLVNHSKYQEAKVRKLQSVRGGGELLSVNAR